MGSWKYLIGVIMVAAILIMIPILYAHSPTQKYEESSEFSFRVMNSTEYVETYAIASGDINGDGIPDLIVGYDTYIGNSVSNLSAYEIQGNDVKEIANLPGFTNGLAIVDPTNVFVASIQKNTTPDLFIHGSYNDQSGVYVLNYNKTNNTFDVVHYFSSGSDCFLLTENNTTYLAVAGDEIYRIQNGTFIPVPNTYLDSGFIKTGKFSNDSNLAIFDEDSGTIDFYNFTNDTLKKTHSLSIDIEVPGWGNDIDYTMGFNKGFIVNSTYDDLFIVTYHNGFTIIHYSNGSFNQTVTAVLNINSDYDAMTSATGKLFNLSKDCIVIGFDNNIYAPLYQVYYFQNGNITAISQHEAEDGNTRVIAMADVDGDGNNDIIVGSCSYGYVRIFGMTTTVPEFPWYSIFIITVITTVSVELVRKRRISN